MKLKICLSAAFLLTFACFYASAQQQEQPDIYEQARFEFHI